MSSNQGEDHGEDQGNEESPLDQLKAFFTTQNQQLAQQLTQQVTDTISKLAKPPAETPPPRQALSRNHLDIQHEFNHEIQWLIGRVEQCINRAVAKTPGLESEFDEARKIFALLNHKHATRQAELETLEVGGSEALEAIKRGKAAKKNAETLNVDTNTYLSAISKPDGRDKRHLRESGIENKRARFERPFRGGGGFRSGGTVANPIPAFAHSYGGGPSCFVPQHFQQQSQQFLHQPVFTAPQPVFLPSRFPSYGQRVRGLCHNCHEPGHVVANCPSLPGGASRAHQPQ
jgi:hypothetical protein